MIKNQLLYLKLCWNRTLSHINVPLSIIDKIAMALIIFKLWEIKKYWLIGVSAIVVFITWVILGHLDIKYKIMDAEMSLHNKYNPEIREMYERISKDKE